MENGDFSTPQTAAYIHSARSWCCRSICILVSTNAKWQARCVSECEKSFFWREAACLFVFTRGWAEVIRPLLLLAACNSPSLDLISANVRQEPGKQSLHSKLSLFLSLLALSLYSFSHYNLRLQPSIAIRRYNVRSR